MSEPTNIPESDANDATRPEVTVLDETKAALSIAADLFPPFGMKPSPIAWSGEAVGVLVGEVGDERHALFVHLDTQPPADLRRALEPSPEELALAKNLRSTPHVLRFVFGALDHLCAELRLWLEHEGFRRTPVGLLGAAQFQYHVARSSGYARSLRGRVTVAGHLSRLGGRLSRLRLGITRYHNELVLRLRIDDREPVSDFVGYYPRFDRASRCRVDTRKLLDLSSAHGKGTLLTCWCGDSDCIMRTPRGRTPKGNTVIHEGPLTLWKIDVLRDRPIYVFDRTALRREILRGVGALIRASRSNPGMVVFPDRVWLAKILADARRDTPVDEEDPESLALSWMWAIR